MTAIVAVVGRPNVGKSTLFNRLAGKSLAIVHDAPGVTRDRNYADTSFGGREMTLIDTGGFDPTTDDPMGQGIARHVHAAIDEADVVVCVLDGSLPPTQPDRDAVELLRRSSKPVIFVANKIDGTKQEWSLGEHFELGMGDLIGVSALHGRHMGKLEAAIVAALPRKGTEAPSEEHDDDLLRLALIGRPNAGKSSLFNRLSDTDRSLVDNRPGTTRDPVDTVIDYKGQRIQLVDTAGVRRKTRVEQGVESQSVIRSIRMLGRAQVVVLMCDVTEGIADQDSRLLALSADRGVATVIGLNKVDLLDKRELDQAKDDARHTLHYARWTPVIPMSAHSGRGVGKLMYAVRQAATEMNKRVGTSELNRFFERVLDAQPPPTRSGKAPRLYYITQAGISPPTFVVFCSSPDHVAESYKRFVINKIREEFGYGAVPVRLFFRGRNREG